MKARKIDHIGIVVKDLDKGLQTFAENFGLQADGSRGGTVERLGIKNAFMPVDDVSLEFIQPISETGPVATFANEKGEGMFMLSLAVEDINAAVEHLRGLGYRVGDPVGGVAFVSMRSTHGVNLQLVER